MGRNEDSWFAGVRCVLVCCVSCRGSLRIPHEEKFIVRSCRDRLSELASSTAQSGPDVDLVSGSSSSGIFSAVPLPRPSSSSRIWVTMSLCLPCRPVGTSARGVVLNLRASFCGMDSSQFRIFKETLKTDFAPLTYHNQCSSFKKVSLF